MGKRRNYYKYVYKLRRKVVHGGITTDLGQRKKQHQAKRPGGHIVQLGRRTTKEAIM